MLYPVALLEAVERLETIAVEDVVYRHMLGDISPARANTRGARWNPPDVAAIYASFERETALAEANYHLSLQVPPIRVRRTIYRIRVNLQVVTAMRDADVLLRLGIDHSSELAACQRVGGTVASLGRNGLIVPSLRHGGLNLVIYPKDGEIEPSQFEIVDSEILLSS